MMRQLVRLGQLFVAVILCGILGGGTASAATVMSSQNYQFENMDLGAGGIGVSNSPDYRSNLSTGDSAVGTTSSTNYQFEAGSNTTGQPSLSISILTPSPSFGSFSPTTAATATSQFSVSDYTSYGYVVQIEGSSPTNGKYTIAPMTTDAASQPGKDQFGINLVANTAPTAFGANPNNGKFGFGAAAANYNTANEYRYVSGDVIASAPKSSGQTIYTISYIVNVASLTTGGQYTSNQSLICTATY